MTAKLPYFLNLHCWCRIWRSPTLFATIVKTYTVVHLLPGRTVQQQLDTPSPTHVRWTADRLRLQVLCIQDSMFLHIIIVHVIVIQTGHKSVIGRHNAPGCRSLPH